MNTVTIPGLIYVAGPLRGEDMQQSKNVEKACTIARALVGLGCTPILPHIFPLWEIYAPMPEENWMELCLRLLSKCCCVLVIGDSPGTRLEVARAKALNIPIYEDIIDAAEYAKGCGHVAQLRDIRHETRDTRQEAADAHCDSAAVALPH